MALDDPVTALDAATGKTLQTYGGSDKAEEILYHDGTLLVAVGGVGWAVRDRAAQRVEAARQRASRQQQITTQVELLLVIPWIRRRTGSDGSPATRKATR